MARQVITKITCDIHPDQEATETVHLTVGDVAVELDLGDDAFEEFNEDVKPYLAAGRKLAVRGSRQRAVRGTGNGSAPKSQAPLIRAWAKEQGLSVPDRGRIPAPIAQQYADSVSV